MEDINLTFLGAASTVTGSKTLVEFSNTKLIVDSGMFQGPKEVQEQNSKEISVVYSEIDYIFLTHGHLDHCGYLPIMVKNGFHGKIFCSEGTKEIVEIILKDSARVQKYDLKEGKINEILYDEYDVDNTLSFFHIRELDTKYEMQSFSYEFIEAGHILGATSIIFNINNKRICFSGDIGRVDDAIHNSPNLPDNIDFLVLESTYGNRNHELSFPCLDLKAQIQKIKETNGVLLIPAFAVARTQILVFELFLLFRDFPNSKIPVFVDSPMGVKVTHLYERLAHNLKIEGKVFREAMKTAKFMEFGNDFDKLANAKPPFILISSSGMISGGKVVKYFDMFAKHEKNTILLSGYQGSGTIGNQLVNGERKFKILGHKMEVRARVDQLKSMSAHADRSGLKSYVEANAKNLKKVFLNHGEIESVNDFKQTLEGIYDFEVIGVEKDNVYSLGDEA